MNSFEQEVLRVYQEYMRAKHVWMQEFLLLELQGIIHEYQ